jgi:hypothetical protein
VPPEFLAAGAFGQLASTSGNITGVYDMSGGAQDYVAIFNSAYSGNLFGNLFAPPNQPHFAATGKTSTKYETAYYHNGTADLYADDRAVFRTYLLRASRTGDATIEVSELMWSPSYNAFINTRYPFYCRRWISPRHLPGFHLFRK